MKIQGWKIVFHNFCNGNQKDSVTSSEYQHGELPSHKWAVEAAVKLWVIKEIIGSYYSHSKISCRSVLLKLENSDRCLLYLFSREKQIVSQAIWSFMTILSGGYVLCKPWITKLSLTAPTPFYHFHIKNMIHLATILWGIAGDISHKLFLQQVSGTKLYKLCFLYIIIQWFS